MTEPTGAMHEVSDRIRTLDSQIKFQMEEIAATAERNDLAMKRLSGLQKLRREWADVADAVEVGLGPLAGGELKDHAKFLEGKYQQAGVKRSPHWEIFCTGCTYSADYKTWDEATAAMIEHWAEMGLTVTEDMFR